MAHREPARSDYLDSPRTRRCARSVCWTSRPVRPSAAKSWAVGATLYNMQYTDQLVATGQLNDVGNVVRVNVATATDAVLKSKRACS